MWRAGCSWRLQKQARLGLWRTPPILSKQIPFTSPVFSPSLFVVAYPYYTATLWLLTVPLWYAKLNKAAEQQKQLYLRFNTQIQGPICRVEVKSSVLWPCLQFTMYYPSHEIHMLWDSLEIYKEMNRLTRGLPASSQEHRCCPLHSPTESEPERCTLRVIKKF